MDFNRAGAVARRQARWPVYPQRSQDGQILCYIEGWYAIAEANRPFGFACWGREAVSLRYVSKGLRQGRPACAYIAHIYRPGADPGESLVCRHGHGSDIGVGPIRGEAHEMAVKEAETDATKRALVICGNPREQRQMRRPRRKPAAPIEWLLHAPTGAVAEHCADPTLFCSARRRAVEATPAGPPWVRSGSLAARARNQGPLGVEVIVMGGQAPLLAAVPEIRVLLVYGRRALMGPRAPRFSQGSKWLSPPACPLPLTTIGCNPRDAPQITIEAFFAPRCKGRAENSENRK